MMNQDQSYNQQAANMPHDFAPQSNFQHQPQPGSSGFKGRHVYGGKAALSIDCSYRNGVPAVNISAAPAVTAKRYDWRNKIVLLISEQEWPQVMCVLLGFKQSVEFKHHGALKNKGFSLKRQPTGVFIQVFEAKTCFAVPVSAADLFHITAMMLGHYAGGIEGVSAGELPNLLAATTAECQ